MALFGKVLSLNCCSGGQQRDATKEQVIDSLQNLNFTLRPDIILLQEYKSKPLGGLSVALNDGTTVWKAVQMYPEKDKVPIILHTNKFRSTGGQPLHLLAPGSFEFEKDYAAFEKEYAGRYTAAVLISTKHPLEQQKTHRFLVVSYHGRYKKRGDVKQDTTEATGLPTPAEVKLIEKRAEDRRTEARRFIRAVGAASVALGIPALIGGDWNCQLEKPFQLPADDAWEVRLKTVAGYLPDEDACARYNQPCIDYFCYLWPLVIKRRHDPSAVLLATKVRAQAHVAYAERYDHDPVMCDYQLLMPGAVPAGASVPLAGDNHGAREVLRQELSLLTREQLWSACEKMRLPIADVRANRERNTLVKALLTGGVVHSHLCSEARQFLAYVAGWRGVGAAKAAAVNGKSGSGGGPEATISAASGSGGGGAAAGAQALPKVERLGAQRELDMGKGKQAAWPEADEQPADAAKQGAEKVAEEAAQVAAEAAAAVKVKEEREEGTGKTAAQAELAAELQDLSFRQLEKLCSQLGLPDVHKAGQLLLSGLAAPAAEAHLRQMKEQWQKEADAKLERLTCKSLKSLCKQVGLHPKSDLKADLVKPLQQRTGSLPELLQVLQLLEAQALQATAARLQALVHPGTSEPLQGERQAAGPVLPAMPVRPAMPAVGLLPPATPPPAERPLAVAPMGAS